MVRILHEREVQALWDVVHQLEDRGLTGESAQLRLILEAVDAGREADAPLAARILHRSPETVETLVRRGRLAGRVDEDGAVFVDADALWRAVELDRAMPGGDLATPEVSEADILAEIATDRGEQTGQ